MSAIKNQVDAARRRFSFPTTARRVSSEAPSKSWCRTTSIATWQSITASSWCPPDRASPETKAQSSGRGTYRAPSYGPA